MKTSTPERIQKLTQAGLWGDKTLCDYLSIQAEKYPNAMAAADQHTREQLTDSPPLRLTFSELDNASDALAIDLLQSGVTFGDRVMLQMPNVVDLMVLYYALSKLGAIASPLPVQYGRHEISSLASTLEPAYFIGAACFRDANLAENGLAALPAQKILAMGDDLVVRGATGLGDSERNVLQRHRSDNPASANDICTICWTSGTTGTPKGVPRSHNMWLASGHMTATGSEYQPGDVLLNPFPMVNMSALGGFLFPAAKLGCGIVLHHPLDVPVFLEQIQRDNVTFTIAPPALLNKLAKEPALWSSFDFPALRGIGSGSAPLAPEMIATFERDYGVNIYNIYGSNEGIALISSPAAIPDPEERAAMFPRSGTGHTRWTGPLHETVRSTVVDPETGNELTQKGDRGELCFSGPTVFDGYLNSSRDDLFTSQGFFRTGDVVEICGGDSAFYRIAGRLKDIINRGGMKISPAELDTLLEGHPALAEAAVCAYPDAILGEKICVCIVPTDGGTPSLEDICAFLMQCGVAKFKLPERLLVIEALPRNPLGKVLRHELAEWASEEGVGA